MKMKQTAATKIRSKNFGAASTAAKILRQHFGNHLPFPKDKRMQSRFGGAIAKWLGNSDAGNLPPQENLGYINGFAFNADASVAALWKVPLSVTKENDRLITIHIPAVVPTEKLLAPAGTVQVICTVTAASWNWFNPNQQNSASKTISISHTNEPFPSQDVLLAVPASRSCLLATIVSLEFINKRGEKDNRTRYLACNVVDARYC